MLLIDLYIRLIIFIYIRVFLSLEVILEEAMKPIGNPVHEYAKHLAPVIIGHSKNPASIVISNPAVQDWNTGREGFLAKRHVVLDLILRCNNKTKKTI